MSHKFKSEEESDPTDSAVTETPFHELLSVDWKTMKKCPLLLKYKFDENGYTLMVSTLTAVYGEKLDLDAMQKRFQNSNQFAEMLPKVMLKHLEKSVETIIGDEHPNIHLRFEAMELKIRHKFIIKNLTFQYPYAPLRLPFCEIRAHILKPILLRALILDEEKAVLQRKVEELEERHGSSSSNGCGKRNFKEVYSALDTCVIKEFEHSEPAFVKSFMYLQKNKTILPKSLETTPNVSPTKGVNSSSTNASLCNRLKDSKNATENILYNEDDSHVIFGSQYIKKEPEEPEISRDIEKAEDGVSNLANNSSANNLLDGNKPISPKKEMVEESNLMDAKKPVSVKREMEEERKEESTSMPTPDLKPSLAKKKKHINF